MWRSVAECGGVWVSEAKCGGVWLLWQVWRSMANVEWS